MSEKQLKPKEIFEAACAKLAQEFSAEGFKPLQKARLLRKFSHDKLFKFELRFDTSFRNYAYHVALLPCVIISSPALAKWQNERYGGENSGMILHNRIEYLTPLAVKTYDYNVILAGQGQEIARITQLVRKYIMPIFERFECARELIGQLANGGKISEFYEDKFYFPVDLLLWLGGVDAAQAGFTNWLKSGKFTGRAKQIYAELAGLNLNPSEILHLPVKNAVDIPIRKAFIAG